MAIDGDVQDAMSIYKEFQPILMSVNTQQSAFSSQQPSPMPERPKGNKARHRKQDSFSIKLTPAAIDENYAQTPHKLVPPSPSRSKSRSKVKLFKLSVVCILALLYFNQCQQITAHLRYLLMY